MSLTIHNTLTGGKEEFIPLEEGKVKMYVCGVTVYDDIHMGHARSMIVFDTLARYLRYTGYEVTHVTNFTDVDDKIIKRANEEGIDPLALSSRYIGRFFEDADGLGVLRADMYPKASESMDDIIAMVEEIIGSGHGYVTPDGSVYFSVDSVKDYGRLTNQRLECMESSGRVNLDEQKRNPMDFAVWKAAKPGEIYWESPWGRGRPGWHIECSAMIRRHLGDVIDIHGGGNDLIFPHHENEILQTEACTGGPLARYWMHNGMLQTGGDKMSKSLGNFFRVKDVLGKFDRQTVRFYLLNTHYRSPLVYGEDMLEEAGVALRRLWNNYRELQACARDGPEGIYDACDIIDRARHEFRTAMDDDLNTRAAIEAIFAMARQTNRAMGEGALTRKDAAKALDLMKEFDGVLGILPEDGPSDGDTDALVGILIDVRSELRKRKAYDLADMVRDRLEEAGIRLEDSGDGAKWKRI
ncbi:MAG: cysteine--tRNA ligase [Candidatus Methanomethylophilaceae archaeon]|jgi:cysteinyl-tRNA synthetase|nr:cysteine--tRNA ligase [Candidatus Methanomethylophilaceae archaeon]